MEEGGTYRVVNAPEARASETKMGKMEGMSGSPKNGNDSKKTIEIGPDTYREVALALVDAIGESHYYNGSIDTDCGSFYSTLTATLIVYRDRQSTGEGYPGHITDIIPVWWEFSTTVPMEGEVCNDFSFRVLRDAVKAVL